VSDSHPTPNPTPCSLFAHSPLPLHHVLQPHAHVLRRQRREAEARAPALQRGDDLDDVVADQAEARVAGVLLNHCAGWGGRERALRGNAGEGFLVTREAGPGRGKLRHKARALARAPRRRANCASLVIASHSSRITSLNVLL